MGERKRRGMAKDIWIGDVLNGQHTDQEVEIKGWIKRSYGRSNNLRFVVLRDSTGNLQCVGKRDILGDEAFTEFMDALIETSVIFRGRVLEDERAPGGFEFEVNRVQIVGSINPERPFPINKESLEVFDEDGEHMPGGSEFLLNHRHLFLRTSRMTTMLKLRSSAFGAIHNYFREKDFIEYQAPNFVAGAVEGGSTLFEVPYFDKSVPYTIMATLCRSSDACFGTIVYDCTFIQSRGIQNTKALDRILAC